MFFNWSKGASSRIPQRLVGCPLFCSVLYNEAAILTEGKQKGCSLCKSKLLVHKGVSEQRMMVPKDKVRKYCVSFAELSDMNTYMCFWNH